MSGAQNNIVESIDPAILDRFFMFAFDEDTGVSSVQFFAFNTLITLKALAPKELCSSAFREIKSECERYESLFSRHIPKSNIARLNAALGKEVAIDTDTYELLVAARHYCAKSEGVFDISIGPALALWDFARGVIPNSQKLARSLPHIDWRMLQLRNEENQFFAHLSDPEGMIDVGGIAKGYIADKLALYLSNRSIDNFIINLGGNVVVRGRRPDGLHWRVGVQDPRGQLPVLCAIEVVDASAVTSGTYERSFTKEGVLYHHILDPQTGYPVHTDVAGVTVVATTSLDAEGYSTTLLALGIERGSAFVRKHEEILAAYFVDSEGTVFEVCR